MIMKKIFSSSLILAVIAITIAGCLKDKGFQDNKYGINDPDKSAISVGFPLAKNAKNTKGLDVSATPQVFDDIVVINLNSSAPAKQDIHITLVVNPSLITNYNAATGATMQVLTAGQYTVPLTATIPAGSTLVKIPITVPSTTSLSATASYGIGLSIASVDGGYLIAQNQKDLLVEIVIKNKYDGKYHLRGFHNRPGLDAPYDETVYMITSGPNSIAMWWPANGASRIHIL